MQQVHPDSGELLARFPPGRAAELNQKKPRHGRLWERRFGFAEARL
jgi:hypothetical protein